MLPPIMSWMVESPGDSGDDGHVISPESSPVVGSPVSSAESVVVVSPVDVLVPVLPNVVLVVDVLDPSAVVEVEVEPPPDVEEDVDPAVSAPVVLPSVSSPSSSCSPVEAGSPELSSSSVFDEEVVSSAPGLTHDAVRARTTKRHAGWSRARFVKEVVSSMVANNPGLEG